MGTLVEAFVKEALCELKRSRRWEELMRLITADVRFVKDIKDQYVLDSQNKLKRRLTRGEKSKITRFVRNVLTTKQLDTEHPSFSSDLRRMLDQKFDYFAPEMGSKTKEK
jgi:hypothetical protein